MRTWVGTLHVVYVTLYRTYMSTKRTLTGVRFIFYIRARVQYSECHFTRLLTLAQGQNSLSVHSVDFGLSAGNFRFSAVLPCLL